MDDTKWLAIERQKSRVAAMQEVHNDLEDFDGTPYAVLRRLGHWISREKKELEGMVESL